MEVLKKKKDKFLLTVSALEKSLSISLKKDLHENMREVLVASDIKHFEMCYESCWHFLQFYLIEKHNLQLNSPKKVFRECFTLGLIDSETTEGLLDMSEARNATVHEYDEETALETCNRLRGYIIILQRLGSLE